jgi:hypothetical protein
MLTVETSKGRVCLPRKKVPCGHLANDQFPDKQAFQENMGIV